MTDRDTRRLAELMQIKADLSRRLLVPEPLVVRVMALRRSNSSDPAVNVQGIGVGFKVVSGRITSEPAIKIYVRHKQRKADIGPGHLLPASIDGLPTDVEEIGFLQPLADQPNPRLRLRPVRPGCSTGFEVADPAAALAGTVGALVEDGHGRYLLSNNHVMADQNRLPFGGDPGSECIRWR